MQDLHPPSPKARSQILNLYAIFSVSLVLSFLPHIILSMLGLVFSFVVLIACYMTRRKHADEFFTISHLTLIIRSFWAGSFIMLATAIPATLLLMKKIDNAPLEPCFRNINPDLLTSESADQFTMLQTTLKPCMEPYIHGNTEIYALTAIIAFAPGLVYIALQYSRGFRLARKSLPAPVKKAAL
ncbi:MAG: hypothetical protein JWO78_1361 [Micavibrio sp.]|nr:hypothetical protein [Micavibrio sp.]